MPGITIDSKIDTKPVSSGLAELNRELQSLKATVSRVGKDMDASVVGYAKAMQNNAVAAREVNARVTDLRETYEGLVKQVQELADARIDTPEYANLKQEIIDTEKALKRLQETQQRLKDLGRDALPTQEYASTIKSIEKVNKEYETLSAKYNQLIEEQEAYAIKHNEINAKLLASKQKRTEYEKQLNTAPKADKAMFIALLNATSDEIKKYTGELKNAQKEADQYNSVIGKIESRIFELRHEYTQLNETKKNLESTGGDVLQTEAMRRNQYEIQKTTDLLKKQQEQKAEMEASGKATVAGESTKEYGEMLSRAAAAEEKLSEAVKQASEITKPLYVKEWEQMATITGTVANGFARLQNAAQTAGYAVKNPLEALDRILPVVLSGFANLARNILNVAVSMGKLAVSSVVSAFKQLAASAVNAAMGFARMVSNNAIAFIKRLGNAARTTAVQLAKMIGRGVMNGLRTLGQLAANAGKALIHMGRSAKSSNGGLKQSLTTILRYTLGIRSLFMLVRRLRSAVIDAFKNMATSVPEVNTAISNLASSLDMLKNSLATAFQPILSVVAPYLSQFMDMLSNALTQVGMFFAALTGQGYVYKATKAQVDYAKSLDKTKKKAKEAQNQLAGFDHLNILSDSGQDDSDSNKNETPTAGFEKVPVDSKIQDFVDKLVNAFKNGELYKIGKQFADLVNNIIENVIKWEKIGKTFGKVINGIVDAYNGFMDNVKWEELGKGIGKAFDGLIDTVDWENLGKALSQKINALFGILWGFVQDKERWKKAGKALAELAWGYFGNIKWDLIAKTIGTAINGIASLIIEFAEHFPWAEMGEKIRAGFALLVSTIDIEEIYKAFSSIVSGMLDLITPILTDTETWGKIAADFKDFLHRFFTDEELWSKATTAIKGAFRTLIFSLNTVFGDQTLFAEIGSRLATFLNDLMGDKKMWDGIGQLANDMMKDVLSFGQKFIGDFDPKTAAENIKSALGKIEWKNIATDTWNLLKTAFSKAGSFIDAMFSESTDGLTGKALSQADAFNAKPIGERMAIKFKAVFADTGLWEDIAKTVWEAIQSAFTMAGDFITALLGIDSANMNAEERLEAIGTTIGEKLTEFAGVIMDELPQVFEVIGNLLHGLVAGLLGDESGNGKLLLWIAGGFAAIKLGLIPIIGKFMAGLAAGFTAGGPVLMAAVITMCAGVIAAGTVYLVKGIGEMQDLAVQQMEAHQSEMETVLSLYIKMFQESGAESANAIMRSYWGIEVEGNNLRDNLEKIGRGIADDQNEIFSSLTSDTKLALEAYRKIFDEKGAEAANKWAEDNLKIILASEDMQMNMEALTNALEGYAMSGSTNVSQLVSDACSDILIEGEATSESLKTTVGQAVSETETVTGNAATTIKDNITYPYKGTSEEIKPELDAIGRAVNEATGDIVGDVESNMNEQSRVYDEKTAEMYRKASQHWNDIKSVQETANSAMTGNLSSTIDEMARTDTTGHDSQYKEYYDHYGKIMYIVDTCMADAASYMKQHMDEMVKHAQQAMNQLTTMNWDYIGTSIINGIARGINNGWGWLNKMVWNLAVSLFNTAKAALGIASPSKAFYFVGDMVGVGIAEGIGNSKDDVVQSLEGVNNALMKEGNAISLNVTDQELKDLFGTMVKVADEAQDEIKSKSWGSIGEYITDGIRNGIATGWDALESFVNDRIDSLYSSFNDRLQAMADNVSFRMPSIAAGTVVPYAVQGNSTPAPARDATTVLEQNNEELISVIIQAVNGASAAVVRAIQEYCTYEVTIGDKMIGDASIREINRRTKAFGVSPLDI